MKSFKCDVCGRIVALDARECLGCGARAQLLKIQKEEHLRKEQEYWSSPEGIAEKKRQVEAAKQAQQKQIEIDREKRIQDEKFWEEHRLRYHWQTEEGIAAAKESWEEARRIQNEATAP